MFKRVTVCKELGSLVIYVVNIRSLTEHYDELNHFIMQHKPNVVCLTETRLTEDIEDDEVHIDGYTVVRTNSNSRHTGGVMFYISNNLVYQITDSVIVNMNYWVSAIVIKVCNISVNIVGVYRSPSGSSSQFIHFP